MNKVNQKKGFTLIEAMIAITVLVAGITAPIVIAYRSIESSNLSRDYIAAYYFAQEGLEHVRYTRDTNIINGRSWLTYLDRCGLVNANPCDVDHPTIAITNANMYRNCGGGGCDILLRTSDGLYGGSSGAGGTTDTGFDRTIVINDDVWIANGPEATVTVTVTWTSSGVARSYTLTETIFDWSGI